MSNLGLEKYLKTKNLNLFRTEVGDRYVLEYMRANGCNLGGEQSGHIIMSDYATTGDGIIAALQMLAIAVSTNKTINEITRVFEPLPQQLLNLRIGNINPLEEEEVKKLITQGQSRLGEQGRVLIRKSGTEPLIRVMVEGQCQEMVAEIVASLGEVIQKFTNKK
jgi:phosphoglucosamine mutase